MKAVALILFLIASCSLIGQQDSIQIISAPTLTDIGKPTGEKLSQKLNKDGGRISSADGRIELIIPEDALKSKTTISIQAVENTLSPGKGNAYELEPSGTTFQKPVQIIFHYSEKESIGVMPVLKGIAWQNDKGQWYRLKNAIVDTIAKTVTGNINHFSIWASFDSYKLEPTSARVKVNKQLNLKVIFVEPPQEEGEDELAHPLPRLLDRSMIYVNEVPGGNSVFGTVSGDAVHGLKFIAPASVPERNPVDISVEAYANFNFNGINFNRLKLVSHVTIIDNSYEITVTGYNKQSTLRCTITSLDTGSCILQLNGSRSKLQDIQNMNQKIVVANCPCNVRELNPGGNIGPINIIGASKIDVVPANPPLKPYPSVTIYFTPTTGIISGFAVDPCLGSPGASWPAMPFRALPMVLQFEAKPGEQTLMKGGDANNGFEVKVKRLDEDH